MAKETFERSLADLREENEEMIFSGKITDAKTMAAILAYARKYRS